MMRNHNMSGPHRLLLQQIQAVNWKFDYVAVFVVTIPVRRVSIVGL